MIVSRHFISGISILLCASAVLMLFLFSPSVAFVDRLLLTCGNISGELALRVRQELNNVETSGCSGNTSVERFIDGTSDSLDGVDYTHVSR